jgi:hypothetical protein
METSDQDISAGKSGPIEESDEQNTGQSGDQDISAGKSGPTVEPESDESESSEDN